MMGKRSTFERRPQDAYDTPFEAVAPLTLFLPARLSFWEPCAGSWQLVEALYRADDMDNTSSISCIAASDIEPRHPWVQLADGLTAPCPPDADYIITNPPWTRSILHPMIERFSAMRPTWLLFDADWMHTKQAAPYLRHCRKIVSVGRVKWIPDSPHTGKDNCAWYLFDQTTRGPCEFYGRAA